MSFLELNFLVLAQIGIDVTIVIVFIFLIMRLKYINKGKSFHKLAKTFGSLLTDADKMSRQFKEQLEEKHRLIKRLNEQLDKRIISLNVLLNRADVLLSSHGKEAPDTNNKLISLDNQQTEIIQLAKEGHKVEKIAHMLSIPEEEVKLILDLKQKISQMSHKENVP